MDHSELTIRLPKSNLDFLEAYARAHGLTLAEVIDRSLKLLQKAEESEIHPDVVAITGIVPKEVDAIEEYYNYIASKHQ